MHKQTLFWNFKWWKKESLWDTMKSFGTIVVSSEQKIVKVFFYFINSFIFCTSCAYFFLAQARWLRKYIYFLLFKKKQNFFLFLFYSSYYHFKTSFEVKISLLVLFFSFFIDDLSSASYRNLSNQNPKITFLFFF